jgi:hypothetical protein
MIQANKKSPEWQANRAKVILSLGVILINKGCDYSIG